MSFDHTSVLLETSVDYLNIKPNGVYIDATAGGGGHSELILRKLQKGTLILIDQDPDAIKFLKEKFQNSNNSLICKCNFSSMGDVAKSLGFDQVDGIIFDLGVSSYQLDTEERGFSYNKDSLLDMRMSKSGLSAFDIINNFEEKDISKIILKFGEERFAPKIAHAICEYRKVSPIKTTLQLAQIIKDAIPIKIRHKIKHHPARKTFQAIRIAVNAELENLDLGLDSAFSLLAKNGRIAVISFHSLEDRIVKNKMKNWCTGCICPPDFPVCVCDKKPQARFITKKPIVPDEKEVITNSRSRSAKLRVCEKI